MPIPFRLDPEVEAKGLATLLGTILIGGAKWVWEEAKKKGRRGDKIPAYVRVEQLEAELAKANARAEMYAAECFGLRNGWEDMKAKHRDRQRRVLEAKHHAEMRAKAAEGRARAAQMDTADLRASLRLRVWTPDDEPQRPDQAP